MSNLRNYIRKKFHTLGMTFHVITKSSILISGERGADVSRKYDTIIEFRANQNGGLNVIDVFLVGTHPAYRPGSIRNGMVNTSNHLGNLTIRFGRCTVITNIPYSIFNGTTILSTELKSFNENNLIFPFVKIGPSEEFVTYSLAINISNFHSLDDLVIERRVADIVNNDLGANIERLGMGDLARTRSTRLSSFLEDPEFNDNYNVLTFFNQWLFPVPFIKSVDESVKYFGLSSKKRELLGQDIGPSTPTESIKSVKFGDTVETFKHNDLRFLTSDLSFTCYGQHIKPNIMKNIIKLFMKVIGGSLKKGDYAKPKSLIKFYGHFLPEKSYMVLNVEKLDSHNKVITIESEYGSLKCFEKSLMKVTKETKENKETKVEKNAEAAII